MLRSLMRWEQMLVEETFSLANAGLVGRTVGDIAQERGIDPFDAVAEIVMADDLRTGLVPPGEVADDASWQPRASTCTDPRTVLGGSDSGACLDMQCCAGYTTALLGDSVRDRGLVSSEAAVQQLTDVPASLNGLRGRGHVADGWWADLAIIDPATVCSGPACTVRDVPGDAERLVDAVGVAAVVVNGCVVMRDGAPTGDLPGRLLRSGMDMATVGLAPC